MTDFAINYAYSGFLYAPLILAKELNLLPRNAILRDRHGDLETINHLGQWEREGFDNWFAICDPFARDLSGYAPPTGSNRDPVYIIGAFVGRLPVWLYNTDPAFGRLTSEQDLRKEGQRIRQIIAYRRYNTGYLIGKHVNDIIAPDRDMIKPVEFGQELKDLHRDDLAVTSDILAVARSIRARNDNVVFSLFSSCADLDPFLFTAILTLKSVIDKQLPTVLSVLAGLRTATRQFKTNSVSEEGLTILAAKFADQMPEARTDAERRNTLRDAIRLLYDDNIYPGDLDIDTAEKGYNNASNEWRKSLQRQFGSVEKHKDPIPSLLIKEDWRNHKALARAFAENWRPESAAGRPSASDMSAVKAVAEAWRNDEPVVAAVTANWLSNATSRRILLNEIRKPETTTSERFDPKEFHPPALLVALLDFTLLAVLAITLFFGGYLPLAIPPLGAVTTLMVSGVFVVCLWKPRVSALLWVSSLFYLVQVGCVLSICRDAVPKIPDPFGHQEVLWPMIFGIISLLGAELMFEDAINAKMEAVKKGLLVPSKNVKGDLGGEQHN